ncbi:hypothetical protein AAIR98_000137 [Elusimicrobium simillimum]
MAEVVITPKEVTATAKVEPLEEPKPKATKVRTPK